jgi:hypothetical protein
MDFSTSPILSRPRPLVKHSSQQFSPSLDLGIHS